MCLPSLSRLDTFVMEYLGEVVTTDQYRVRLKTVYNDSGHYHCINLDSGLVIDGGLQGRRREGYTSDRAIPPNVICFSVL